MIKIISSWSNPGGSTVANIRLCNLLNENGHDCRFYGHHAWHLDKCKGDTLDNVNPSEDDILISHFLTIGPEIPRKRHILTLHETNLFPLNALTKYQLRSWDAIHYVSNSQRKFHSVNYPYEVIPNIVYKIDAKFFDGEVAGVIGSIDEHKQTHISIQRALKDGYKKVKVFGEITDIGYATAQKEWIYHDNVELMGHCDDQEKMYSQINKVYHSSKRETFNFIQAECSQMGMPYDGLDSSRSGAVYWDQERILDKWLDLLQLPS